MTLLLSTAVAIVVVVLIVTVPYALCTSADQENGDESKEKFVCSKRIR